MADPKHLNIFSDVDENAPKDTPPYNVMSLSLKTIVNHQENKREVVCAAVRTWPNSKCRMMLWNSCDQCLVAHIEDATPPESLPCTAQTFVRPLGRFPKNFEKAAKEAKTATILPLQNERMLLNSLLGDYLPRAKSSKAMFSD